MTREQLGCNLASSFGADFKETSTLVNAKGMPVFFWQVYPVYFFSFCQLRLVGVFHAVQTSVILHTDEFILSGVKVSKQRHQTYTISSIHALIQHSLALTHML